MSGPRHLGPLEFFTELERGVAEEQQSRDEERVQASAVAGVQVALGTRGLTPTQAVFAERLRGVMEGEPLSSGRRGGFRLDPRGRRPL